MTLADVLASARCLADQRFADKSACLGDLARQAAVACGVAAPVIIEAILHRERLGSTGLGEGIALPHARLSEIDTAFVVITRLREPIPFEAVDDRPVDIVCLVLLPAAKANEQLNVLAGLARRLRDKAIVKALRQAGDAKALRDILIA